MHSFTVVRQYIINAYNEAAVDSPMLESIGDNYWVKLGSPKL
jgi:hypothetical protein